MKKFIFYLILALLLNQCFTGDEEDEQGETKCTGTTKTECEEQKPTDIDKKCIFNKKDSEATVETCIEVPKTCDDYTEGVTETKCNEFLAEDNTNKCVFIPSDTESTTGKCVSQLTACNDEVVSGTMSQTICESRSPEGKICYLDGTTCKEAANCESIILSTSPTEELCGKFTPQDAKCVPSGNNCIENPYCNKATKKNAEDDCSTYELEDSEAECMSKSETKCMEVTATEKKICEDLNSAETCKITLNNNILYECQWSSDDPGSYKLKGKYETCSSAIALIGATNEQCSKLQHETSKFCVKGISGCLEVAKCEDAIGADIEENTCKSILVQSYQECIKGTAGCQIKAKSCTDSTIEYEDGICELLKPDEGKQCYYDGSKCTQADSCANVAETTLESNQMTTVCSLFSEETQDCIPDGKKCKLQAKSSSGSGDNENKDTTKATQSGNEDSKDTTKTTQDGNESGSDPAKTTQGGNEDSKDTTKTTQGGNESGSDTTKTIDGEKNEDGDGEEDSSSGFLSLSFLLLSILAL